ncbi:MAG: HNH endonuclease, partial [Gordonia sp. (in: high G+C Gram-positive bacteria)]
IHTQGWKVRIGFDRHPWFQPPDKTGETGWMRSHHRRTLTMADTAAA